MKFVRTRAKFIPEDLAELVDVDNERRCRSTLAHEVGPGVLKCPSN